MHVGIVHYAAPPVVGGVELTIYHHARILTALGHQVTVVAGRGEPFLPGVNYNAEPLAGSNDEVIIQITQVLAKGQVPDNFEDLVARTQSALLTYLGDCDVVIGHNLFTLHKNQVLTAAVHRLTQSSTGPPWLAWHHDFAWLRPQYQAELYPGEPWELLKRSWPGVSHVTVSQAQQTDLARLYGIPTDDILVISPGVEPVNFYQCPDSVAQLVNGWELLDSDCVFLLPARITRRKNIELGLHWLAAVREMSNWDARLVVTGPPGPHNPANAAYLDHLLELRQELKLNKAAHFVYEAGQLDKNHNTNLLLSDEEVASFYQIADALMFSSRQEGFGIPILEAALARLPIFATDLAPFRESTDGRAKLFSLNTPHSQVAQAIVETLQEDRAFQLRRRVLGQYTWRRLVESKILPLLTSISSSKSRAR